MKLQPKSPDAIRVYMLLGGAAAGFLLAFFLIVPILKNTCTWFTERCTQVTVQRGANGSLLVRAPPYLYYYDGVRYIYAYGDGLTGTCPSRVLSDFSPEPTVAAPIPNFCFRFRPATQAEEQAGEEATQECADPLPQNLCARVASPVPGSTGKFTCDGKTALDAQVCCNTIAPCANPAEQCATSVPAVKQADGTFKCERGTLDGQLCQLGPRYDKDRGFTCDGTSFTAEPQCCYCTSSFTRVSYGGTTDAVNIYQPVFTVDAAAMSLVPVNQGILCGLKQELVMNQFKDVRQEKVQVTLGETDRGLNIYQVFEVLRRSNIFRAPSKA